MRKELKINFIIYNQKNDLMLKGKENKKVVVVNLNIYNI